MSLKTPIGYKPGQKYFMDEKVPKNPRYEDVKGKLDTGLTVAKVVVLSDNNVAKRRAEVFYRLRHDGLAELLGIEKNTECIYNMGDGNDRDNQSTHTHNTTKTIQTTKTEQQFKLEITDKTDYILIDMREESEFEKYRIKDAVNFPSVLIPRDKFPQQMYALKNRPDKLIIVYHCDDKNGVDVAKALYEKGFDNIYMLSGGIEDFYQKYPDLCAGNSLPPLKKDIEAAKLAMVKPRIRKTKEEVIMENEMQWMLNKKQGPSTVRSGSQGFNVNSTKGPKLASNGFRMTPSSKDMDPLKIDVNRNFDAIPSPPNAGAGKKPPLKPKGIKQMLGKDKEEKPLTDKVTNMAIDGKTEVGRKIDRLHGERKEVTQKPNFPKFQGGDGASPKERAENPYV